MDETSCTRAPLRPKSRMVQSRIVLAGGSMMRPSLSARNRLFPDILPWLHGSALLEVNCCQGLDHYFAVSVAARRQSLGDVEIDCRGQRLDKHLASQRQAVEDQALGAAWALLAFAGGTSYCPRRRTRKFDSRHGESILGGTGALQAEIAGVALHRNPGDPVRGCRMVRPRDFPALRASRCPRPPMRLPSMRGPC